MRRANIWRVVSLLLVATVLSWGGLAPAPASAAGWRHSHGAQYYNSVAGDSWTLGNESVRSLGGSPGAPGSWSYAWFAWDVQYASASGAQTTNDGYGGQNSQTIYNNIYALVGPAGTTPTRANDNWTWWGGRNDVSAEPGESWPLYTDGTFTAPTTGTTANSSTAISSVASTATLVSGVKYLISGTCIPAGDTIASFTANTITMTVATNSSGCSGAGTALAITAGGTTQYLALIPHERKLIMLPYSGSGVGTADWARLQRLKWTYWRTHRKYYFNVQQYFFGLSPNGSSGNAADDADVSAQALITSLNGNSHPNYLAMPLIAAAIRGPLDAMAGRRVWVLSQTIPDVRYDLGTGGSVGTVYGYGNITGWSIATDDPTNPGLVTINASTGELTRTSISPGTLPSLNLTVTATGLDYKGNAVTHTNNVRILSSMIGATSTVPVGATFPRDAVSVTKRWPRLSASVTPYTNNAKWTFIVRFKPGEDGTTLNLWVAGTTIIVNRTTGNKIAVTIKDSAAGSALAITSVTTNYTVANGYQWVLFSIDLSVPSYTLYSVNASGTATSIAPAGTPTAGSGLVGLATNPPNMFVASLAGASTFVGSVTEVIAAQGVAVDFTNSANRALFVDSSGNPVDQGTSCAIGLGLTPEVCFRGVAGDWVTGKNFGSGADWGWNDTWLSGLPSSDPTGP